MEINRKIKRLISLLMCILLVFPSIAFADQNPDITGHWAEKDISNWVGKGYVKGFPDGTFRPDDNITRAEFMTIVNRGFELSKSVQVSFKDTKPNDWFYNEIGIAVNAGYIKGFADNTIKPLANISRQEAAIILARLLKIEETADSKVIENFKDGAKIPEWSRKAMAAIAGKEYLRPDANGNILADKPITRGEAIFMLNRSYLKYAKVEYNTPGTYTGNTIGGSVVIKSRDITLKDTVIEGDLILAKEIGDGNVYLKNVLVKGDTIVKGGGTNSIYMEDSTFFKIIIEKEDNKIRLVASGNTRIEFVDAKSGAILEEQNLSNLGFTNVEITGANTGVKVIELKGNFENVLSNGKDFTVKISGGTVRNLEVSENSTNNQIDIAADSQIIHLIIDAITKITGSGIVKEASVSVIGSTIEVKIEKLEMSPELVVTIPLTVIPSSPGGTGGGGGGGGGGSSTTPSVTLSSIAITSPATKLVYTVGEPLDISGLVVAGTYSNSTTKVLSITASNITGFNSSAPAASQTLTITVGGRTATYNIAINAAPVATLSSIAVTTHPTKLVYTVGETLDITGLVVTGTYSDLTTKVLSITASNITGFNSSVPAASQTLTITVGGKTATCTIEIKPVVISDTTKPIITLLGSTPVNLANGASYTDAGATASDNIDGDITADIVTTGIVNTAVEGSYVIHYNVSDAAGNAAVEVTRTVNVAAPVVVVGVTGVTLNKTASALLVGGTETLIATVAPTNATNKNLIWTSSNTAVATVDSNGTITGGPTASTMASANITAKTVDGNKVATCSVRVLSEAMVIADINAGTAANMAAKISQYSTLLGLDLTVYNLLPALDKTQVHGALAAATFTTLAQIKPAFDNAIAVQLAIQEINSATVDTVGSVVINNAAILGVVLTDYNALTDKSPVHTALKLSNFASATQFRTAFNGSVAIEEVNEATIATMGTVISKNATILGLTLTTYNTLINKTPVYTAMEIPTFVTASEVKAAFNAAVLAQKTAETPVTPLAPNVTADDTANLVIGMAVGMEYKLDGAEYTAYDEAAFALVDFSGDHTVLVRVAAEGVNPFGPDTVLTFTTNPVATLSSIAITAPAAKLVYTVGETLDITGLVVTGTYSDSTTKVEAVTASNITGFDSTAPAASQILTITIEGVTTTYTVEIKPIIVPDTTKPVITLLGSTPVNLANGASYTDAGATASDNIDGDITADIVTTGTVNTAVEGAYVIRYNVSDAAGNAAVEVTRTVNVAAPIVITASATLAGELLGVKSYAIQVTGAAPEDVTDVLVNGVSKTFQVISGVVRVNSGSTVTSLKIVVQGQTIDVSMPVVITATATLVGELLGVKSYGIQVTGAAPEDVTGVLVNGVSKPFQVISGLVRVNSGTIATSIEIVVLGQNISVLLP